MARYALIALLLAGCGARRHLTIDAWASFDRYPTAGGGPSAWYGPCSVSIGVWVAPDGKAGPYSGVGCSWAPFAGDKKAEDK